MALVNYREEMGTLPVLEQSETTYRKYKTWQKAEAEFDFYAKLNDDIFGESDKLTQSRKQLFELGKKVVDAEGARVFWIHVFYWGFSKGGRGNMFLRALNNADRIESFLVDARNLGTINMSDVQIAFEGTGMRVNTYSKLLYFLGVQIEGYSPLIFDDYLRIAVTAGPFSNEFIGFMGLKRMGQMKKYYVNYLKEMQRLSSEIGVEAAQLEYFLFSKRD
jgi:hypothetical protein